MRHHYNVEVRGLHAVEERRRGSSHRAFVSERLQDRLPRFDVLSAIIDEQNPGWPVGVAGKSFESYLVSTLTVSFRPDYLKASTPAAILDSNQSARFDSPIQATKACSFLRDIEGLTLLDVNLSFGIQAPDCDLMPYALPLFTSQFHACADATSEPTHKDDYKGNKRVTLEVP